jgi:hypothetical protein
VPLSGSDLDTARLRRLRLGHLDAQHPLAQRRLDAFGVDLAGQDGAVLELAGPPGAAAQHTGALALLELTADDQLPVGLFDVDVVALDAGDRVCPGCGVPGEP